MLRLLNYICVFLHGRRRNLITTRLQDMAKVDGPPGSYGTKLSTFSDLGVPGAIGCLIGPIISGTTKIGWFKTNKNDRQWCSRGFKIH